MRLVLVEWTDAQADAVDWSTREELTTDARLIRTVGYVIPDVIDEHITVAASWDEYAEVFGSVMHIPDAMVKNVRELDVPSRPSMLDAVGIMVRMRPRLDLAKLLP